MPILDRQHDRSVLILRDLNAWYNKSHILHGVNVEVRPGETVSILGRNGAGKTTMLRSIMGLVRIKGAVTFDGRSLAHLPTHEIARRGLALVPENRSIFATLTVQENLKNRISGKFSLDVGFRS